jgi:hypothetical protein
VKFHCGFMCVDRLLSLQGVQESDNQLMILAAVSKGESPGHLSSNKKWGCSN